MALCARDDDPCAAILSLSDILETGFHASPFNSKQNGRLGKGDYQPMLFKDVKNNSNLTNHLMDLLRAVNAPFAQNVVSVCDEMIAYPLKSLVRAVVSDGHPYSMTYQDQKGPPFQVERPGIPVSLLLRSSWTGSDLCV